MTGLVRIIWHWSAGTHTVSALDREHYHFIIDGTGKVHSGKLAPEANLSTSDGQYAAHTRGCNTGSIGIAVAAMAGAVERPFSPGKFPITAAQIEALVKLTRELAAKYKIPVSRTTILSHAEVQPTLKIAQRGKWDIAWLPGMAAPGDPVKVGDQIRAMVGQVKETPVSVTRPAPHVNAEAPASPPNSPAQSVEPVAAPKTRPNYVLRLIGGLLALAGAYAASAWADFTAWVGNLFN